MNSLVVATGWKPAGKSSGGLLSSIIGGRSGGKEIDVDTSIIMLDANGRFHNIVYYGQKDAPGIKHHGDNLVGSSKGDAEQISIDLNKVPPEVDKLVVMTNIYSGANDFSAVQGAYVRVLNQSGNEIARYNLTESGKESPTVIIGEIYKHNGEWKFGAKEEYLPVKSLSEVVNMYKRT